MLPNLSWFTLLLLLAPGLGAQADTTWLQGQWEVVVYGEQGVQVDKRLDPHPQARAVYAHVAERRRSQYWLGYADDYESAERYSRSFRRWQEQDSLRETARLLETIAWPYTVAFFPDSTLCGYNRHPATGHVSNQEVWHYRYNPTQGSLLIQDAHSRYVRWRAQVLALDAQRLILFLPEEAEVVELRRTSRGFP